VDEHATSASEIVGKLRDELGEWIMRRWGVLLLGVLCLVFFIYPGNTVELKFGLCVLVLTVSFIDYFKKSWNGPPQLLLLVKLAERFEEHLENHPDQGTAPAETPPSDGPSEN